MSATNVFMSNQSSVRNTKRVRPSTHEPRNPSDAKEVTNLPVTIQIGNVSGNSGVYVGKQNVTYGLSSHSKSNSGFGDIGDSNLFIRNVSFVYDPDVIDTPIDDRDVHVFQQMTSQSDSSVTNIGVGSVNVNTLQQNAGTFIGTTSISGMDSHEKQNLGHGQVFGDRNINYQSLNLTNDMDVVDAIINDQDNKAGIFVSG